MSSRLARRRASAAHPSTDSSASTGRSPQVEAIKTKSRPAESRRRSFLRSYGKRTFVGLLGAFIIWRAYVVLVQQRYSASLLLSTKISEGKTPAIFSSQPAADAAEAVIEKREAVREAFRRSWHAYERDAFGFDNYHPISRTGSNIGKDPIGYYIVDCLDSLLLLGLDDEYQRSKQWVAGQLSFDTDHAHHAFEITIRVLGGLLSAVHLTSDAMDRALFLLKAQHLADRLMPIFDTPTGIPLSFINLRDGIALADHDNYNFSSIAEVGTLQLEFKYLAHLTGQRKYWDKVDQVMEVVETMNKQDGLVSIYINPKTAAFEVSDLRLGSRADSYYEYLLKQWLQTGASEPRYLRMYKEATTGMQRNMFRLSENTGTIYTQELMPAMDYQTGRIGVRRLPKQDHLVCFVGGYLMLGAASERLYDKTSSRSEDDTTYTFNIGQAITKSCVETYTQSKTGLGAEIVHYYDGPLTPAKMNDTSGRAWFINRANSESPFSTSMSDEPPHDAKYMLRPETVESLFVGWRLTHDPMYRHWGWQIFQAIERNCKVITGGYATVRDVDVLPVMHEDRMETFFLSETLKYLFLLFSDDLVLPLDQYVFNTEAHPLPIFEPAWT